MTTNQDSGGGTAQAQARIAILLIDDDIELCELMQRFFTRRGMDLEVVHDGRRGLARALGGGHDLLLPMSWNQPPNILPYYGAIVLVIAGMGSILALHLAAPLRKLRRVVEHFGRGNIAVRAGTTRKDEIGELSRAFDEMADRIETLLSAERRLLQDVSHELRSPLARLGFAVELAREGDERDEALARVRKEADRMTALVGELLQLTRIEGDPTAGKWGNVALHHLLDDIVNDCDLEAEARGCRPVLRSVQPAVISGERELLHRAVENIVRNAIRHTSQGTTVEIALELRGDMAVTSVGDHGPGVPEALLSDIFKPFFRVEDDRSRASGGVGLGLAIARRAVEVHQGKIAAHNARPGLVITISLPHARAPIKVPSVETFLPA